MREPPEPHRFGATEIASVGRWVTAIAAVGFLSYSASRTVGWSPAAAKGSRVTVRVDVQPEAAEKDRNRDLWLHSLIVDGRLLRFQAVADVQGWRALEPYGSGMPTRLEFGDAMSATMTVPASPVVALIDTWMWPGRFDIQRDARTIARVHLDTVRGTVVMGTDAQSTTRTWLIAVLFLTLTATTLGATSGRHRVAWLVVCLGMLHLLFWISQPIGTTNDSREYLDNFHVMMQHGLPSYFPPGYPLFVGLSAAASFAATGLIVTAVQHGMAVVVGVWVFLLMRRVVAPEFAWIAGALAGGLPAVLTMSQTVMSEIVAMFAMVGAIYLAVSARERRSDAVAIASGMLAGWAIIARVVPVAAIVPAMALIHLVPIIGRTVRPLLISLGTAAAVVAVPLTMFVLHDGGMRLTKSTGLHLFNRVVTEQRQLDADGPATRRLLALLQGEDPRGVAWWDVRSRLAPPRLTGDEFELLLRNVAMEGIRDDPWAYVRLTPSIAWREYVADPSGWIPRWGGTPEAQPEFENRPWASVTATGVRWRIQLEKAHALVWPALCWLAIVGGAISFWGREGRMMGPLAWVTFAYLFASASVEYFAPRHNVPVIPFVVALAVFAISSVTERVSRFGRSRTGVHDHVEAAA